jgi:hypothetical protein
LSDQLADAERRLARAPEAASNDSKRGVFARSERIAGFIITALRFFIVGLLVLVALLDIEGYGEEEGYFRWALLGGLFLLNVLASIHLTGIEILGRPLHQLRSWLALRIYRFLTGEPGPPPPR